MLIKFTARKKKQNRRLGARGGARTKILLDEIQIQMIFLSGLFFLSYMFFSANVFLMYCLEFYLKVVKWLVTVPLGGKDSVAVI
jgi:hypothetical protein